MRNSGLGEIEHGGNIGRDGFIPLFIRYFLYRLKIHLMCGIIYKNVDLIESNDGLVYQLAALPGVGDISGDGNTSSPSGFNEAFGDFRLVMLVQIGKKDVSAFARESERDGASNARVAPGDQRHFAGKVARATIAVFAIIRLRSHAFA
jgi:hypothetical protein